jgi:hypothetical protein
MKIDMRKKIPNNQRRKITFVITEPGMTFVLASDTFFVKTAKQSVKKIEQIFKLKNSFQRLYKKDKISLKLEIETVKLT